MGYSSAVVGISSKYLSLYLEVSKYLTLRHGSFLLLQVDIMTECTTNHNTENNNRTPTPKAKSTTEVVKRL